LVEFYQKRFDLCAILGILGEVDIEKFKHSLNLMKHRGVDFQNILKTPFGIFGFNRLSIENISINLQPLFKNNILVMFNGEIYNYKDLIKKIFSQCVNRN
jgi:asparagine synthase (glutamine-hydrolysing)